MKIQKKNGGGVGGVGGVRVDVNGELKFLGKLKKKNGGGGGVRGGGGSGECERRIEVFVKIKKYIFFFRGGGGRVVGGGGGSGWM